MTSDISLGGLSDNKKNYPGWGILLERVNEKTLKSSDVSRILGISYRQLSDWEKRGVLKTIFKRPRRKKAKGWRTFSIADLISLGLLREAKRQGISITSLQKVMEKIFFTKNLLNETFPHIACGLDIFFYTNFEKWTSYYGIESQNERVEVSVDYLRESNVVVIIPVNRIIDEIFRKLKLPDFEAIKTEDGGYSFKINKVPLALEALPMPTTS
ncbi:MAG: MerR family transcriptional regulator [Deltaproteobacteria bacterium]|nr:MerR family transcriptional regulator [Deltaproteobacteria bacterium]